MSPGMWISFGLLALTAIALWIENTRLRRTLTEVDGRLTALLREE